jgi:hypothetical protein
MSDFSCAKSVGERNKTMSPISPFFMMRSFKLWMIKRELQMNIVRGGSKNSYFEVMHFLNACCQSL